VFGKIRLDPARYRIQRVRTVVDAVVAALKHFQDCVRASSAAIRLVYLTGAAASSQADGSDEDKRRSHEFEPELDEAGDVFEVHPT
jgi:hypothetical protein